MGTSVWRCTRAAFFATTAAALLTPAAFAADTGNAMHASTVSTDVLTPGGIDGRALRLHLAQTLGPDSARESHRYLHTVFGTNVQIGVSAAGAADVTTFARPSPYDSATFERRSATGGMPLLNVAWQGLRHLASD